MITVRSSEAQLQNPVEEVGTPGLNGGNTNALSSKLNHAINSISQGKINVGVNQIEAFINPVNTLVNSGKLTQSEADDLIAAANAAIVSAETISSPSEAASEDLICPPDADTITSDPGNECFVITED